MFVLRPLLKDNWFYSFPEFLVFKYIFDFNINKIFFFRLVGKFNTKIPLLFINIPVFIRPFCSNYLSVWIWDTLSQYPSWIYHREFPVENEGINHSPVKCFLFFYLPMYITLIILTRQKCQTININWWISKFYPDEICYYPNHIT